MVLKHRPIYQCDGCSLEFEDPNKVRIFENQILNGDQTKQYIESGMFCLDCIPLALDFINKNPETVKIIDPIKVLADKEEQFKKDYQKIVNKLTNDKHIGAGIEEELISIELRKTMKDVEIIKDWVRRHNQSSDPIFQISMYDQKDKHLDNSNYPAKSLLPEIELKEEIEQKVFDTIISKEIDQETSQEPEIINENNSEIQDDTIDHIGEETGDYLILRLIDDEITEMRFAQKNNYKDLNELRATCGNKPLIGLYYSINRFVNDPNLDGEYNENYKPTIKIINKMFFGIPSIVERKVFMYENFGIALIEKELFDDKIEAIKYEIPHEEVHDEHNKPSPTINNMLKKFVDETIDKSRPKKAIIEESKSNEYLEASKKVKDLKNKATETGEMIIISTQEAKPKKRFSSSTIGDDYI